MLNINVIFFISGLLVGYFLMFFTSSIINYHGYNSNDIRNKIYYHNENKYRLIPHIIEK